jgi:MFS transporter, DHA2 family, multidrug resistance protein
MGAALVALIFGLLPREGTTVALVVAAVTAAGAAVVSFSRLVQSSRT